MNRRKKTPDLRRGPGCLGPGLDSLGGESNLKVRTIDGNTITHRYRSSTTPFHLVIRRSFQAVGFSAYQINASPGTTNVLPVQQVTLERGQSSVMSWDKV